MKKKILVLYASKGLGHKIIGENMGWHLQQAGYEVKFGDLLKIQEGKLVHVVDKLHTFVNVYMPWFWRFLYTNKIFTDLTLPLRLKVAAKQSDKARELIEQYKPDIILVSHGGFAAVIAYLKKIGFYTKPFVIGFSDYHLHRYWLYDQTDFYIANISEQKKKMIELGIPADRIFVCGITLKPLVKVDPAEVRSKIGLLTSEHLVVLAAGSIGIGLSQKSILDFFETLQTQARKRGIRVVLAVICGKNEKLYQHLTQLKLPNMKVFGYYMPLSELYQVADVYVTKPGGLSTAEALAYRLPMLYTHFLPGQEEWNLEYLIPKGLVMGYIPIHKVDMIVHKVLEEIQTHAFRQNLEKNPLIDQISPTDGKALVDAFDSRIAKY